jgi:hypothetical protein
MYAIAQIYTSMASAKVMGNSILAVTAGLDAIQGIHAQFNRLQLVQRLRRRRTLLSPEGLKIDEIDTYPQLDRYISGQWIEQKRRNIILVIGYPSRWL